MKFIKDVEEFLRKSSEVNSLVVENKTLPDQVFKEQFIKFLIIEFNEIFEEVFFQKMNSFIKKINDSKWTFAALDPKPKDFFHNFKKYPFFEINHSDSYEDYFSVTHNEPELNSDDAIIYNTEVAILYSDSSNWAIYADRDFELGIVGFHNDEIMQSFVSVYEKHRIFSVVDAIPKLLEIVYVNNTVPKDIQTQLLDNYS